MFTFGFINATPPALSLSQALLTKQPDVYTVWNFRRELLLALFASERDLLQVQTVCTEELTFLNSCLERNPKSYGTWFHRQWVMLRAPKAPWSQELVLCGKFLQLDSRNCKHVELQVNC